MVAGADTFQGGGALAYVGHLRHAPPSAEKMFNFDMLNFEKLGYGPPSEVMPPPSATF